MEGEVGVLNIGRRAAVVVDDGHARTGLEQGLVLHLLGRLVSTTTSSRAAVGLQHGLLRGDEGVFVLRLVFEPLDKQRGGVLHRVDDDAAGLALLARDAAHGHGGAHGVQIRELVPMAKTREESAISSARALAITRLLTFVRVSTSLPRPPKNSKLKRFFTTAWSPPRERAISTARELNWKSSPKPLPSTPRPMLTEAWMPLGLTTSCTRSSSGELVRPHLVQVADSKMKR